MNWYLSENFMLGVMWQGFSALAIPALDTHWGSCLYYWSAFQHVPLLKIAMLQGSMFSFEWEWDGLIESVHWPGSRLSNSIPGKPMVYYSCVLFHSRRK
jgi:hypothetical protein